MVAGALASEVRTYDVVRLLCARARRSNHLERCRVYAHATCHVTTLVQADLKQASGVAGDSFH